MQILPVVTCWGCGSSSTTPLCQSCVDARLCHHKVLGVCIMCLKEGVKLGRYQDPESYDLRDPAPVSAQSRRPSPRTSPRAHLIALGFIKPNGLSREPVSVWHLESFYIQQLALKYVRARQRCSYKWREQHPVPVCLADLWARYKESRS